MKSRAVVVVVAMMALSMTLFSTFLVEDSPKSGSPVSPFIDSAFRAELLLNRS